MIGQSKPYFNISITVQKYNWIRHLGVQDEHQINPYAILMIHQYNNIVKTDYRTDDKLTPCLTGVARAIRCFNFNHCYPRYVL